MTNTGTTNEIEIYNYSPASNLALAGALVGLREQIEAAAQANVDEVLATGEEYTLTEQQAMLRIEQLRQVNGLDLAAVLLRAEYLRDIQANNLIARHPAGYTSMQDMASKQGINVAELSQTLDMANIIFPYVEETLGMPIPVLWESVGKSNLRELVPVLKAIITGQPSETATVRESTERILDDVVASQRANGDDTDFTTEEGQVVLVRAAVNQLLEDGIQLSQNRLRERIRQPAMDVVDVSSITRNGDGERIIVATMSDEQYAAFVRRAGRLVRIDDIDMQQFTPQERQRELLRISTMRSLLDMVQNG